MAPDLSVLNGMEIKSSSMTCRYKFSQKYAGSISIGMLIHQDVINYQL